MKSHTPEKALGFSLLELMIVLAVVSILTAMAVPRLLSAVSDISLRYAASDFSGLIQSARIQAVRKNTFYTIVPGNLPSGTPAYYLDLPKAGVYTNGDPMLPISPGVTVWPGVGSGAPNEGTFIANLNFTVNPGGSPISFNARGLPCVAAVNACPQTPGQGFVVFMSKATVMGGVPWAAVVINPSGHIQLWTSDVNGNWIQRD
ncbi:MAG TPA: GspH/FimT family pseudopilin [Candidatus Dormibacteraeota bacterium]|nr:GspH/FimT family pseudopilin [Candidatus Dormibacteraeota bacterium]